MKMKNTCPCYDEIPVDTWKSLITVRKGNLTDIYKSGLEIKFTEFMYQRQDFNTGNL